MSDAREKIRAFVVGNFLFGQAADLRDDTSFLEKGILDSTGVLELVAFLEQTYAIKVSDDELVPDNLDSIDLICAYLHKKTAA
jgi:acyl carrier protein